MAKDIIKLPNKAALDALVQHENGEVAFCEDEQKYYIYGEEGWQDMPVEVTPEGLSINLYELNKQIVAQLPPFDIQRMEDARETVENWKKPELPYLLYGKEISYFTLFSPGGDEEDGSFADCLFDCLLGISGTIYSLDVLNEDTIEIWVDSEVGATALYLFNYENGMVYYHGL